MRVVGIDCATRDDRIGLAFGAVVDSKLRLQRIVHGERDRPAAEQVIAWIAEREDPVLLAVDSPLGWPQPLASLLATHQAGVEMPDTADRLFMRDTDRSVLQRLGKRPLAVGADRIARTAHATLRLIGEIGRGLSRPVPLAWDPESLTQTSVIEVYPAATLTACGWRASGYKKPGQCVERKEIVLALQTEAIVEADAENMEKNADALDAAICALAGADFLRGRSMAPQDRLRAKSEGWIWVRDRLAHQP
jgi:predicted RNase H-like nuclease